MCRTQRRAGRTFRRGILRTRPFQRRWPRSARQSKIYSRLARATFGTFRGSRACRTAWSRFLGGNRSGTRRTTFYCWRLGSGPRRRARSRWLARTWTRSGISPASTSRTRRRRRRAGGRCQDRSRVLWRRSFRRRLRSRWYHHGRALPSTRECRGFGRISMLH